ncbi:MAG: DNA-directed RNA polymerase subunit omega [Kiritimatiellae bacterium]|nr:DNA-directed RNA polymerase subunit omega [Kiritimatiellia bacterium]MBR1836507.1 DNA-directed RNA polymerase subunit omega [Kiritimatiellia bacterium]
MNFQLLDKAKARVSSIPVLVNMCSLRVKQLNQGMRPLLKPEPGEETIDTVLREIAEGKLISQVDFETLERRGLAHG